MDKNKLIDMVKVAHKDWAINHKITNKFNYEFLRKNYPQICSSLRRKKSFKNISELYLAANINPNCHKSTWNYGEDDEERRETWIILVNEIVELYGVEILNDNTMNKETLISPTNIFSIEGNFLECRKYKCEYSKITLRSIYAQGRRLFGRWDTAINKAGFDYDRDVLRRISKIKRRDYLKEFKKFIDEKKNWSIKGLRKDYHKIYSGLRRSHPESEFSSKIEDYILCAYVEVLFNSQKKIKQADIYYKNEFPNIRNHLYENVLLQNVWQNSRNKIKGNQRDDKKLKYELLSRYGAGVRLTRRFLQKSKNKNDTALLSTTRRRSEKGIDHNQILKSFGILTSELKNLYEKLDDKYTVEFIYQELQRLMRKSIERKFNCLNREYVSENERELHNAIIRKYKSWESGLKNFGLDTKFFSLSANKRAKRGLVFQMFVKELLLKYGYNLTSSKSRIINSNEFVYEKVYNKCKHKPLCKPDFVFKDCIIDTKTGYSAKFQENQVERYLSHKSPLYILTLRNKFKEFTNKKKKLIVIDFENFVKNSKKILGVKIDEIENKNLTRALNNSEWDPFVNI